MALLMVVSGNHYNSECKVEIKAAQIYIRIKKSRNEYAQKHTLAFAMWQGGREVS